jgi:hypothetical protein
MSILSKLSVAFKSFKKDQRGVAAIIAAVALPAVMGTVGLAVDSTRYFRAKQIVIDAADQAALSAAAVDIKDGGETREQIAAKFFKANVPADFKDIVDLKAFTFTDDSATTSDGKKNGAVVINYKVDAGIKPLIAQVVGVDFLNLSHSGQAIREIMSLEVVLGLSMSGTMCSTKERKLNPSTPTLGDTMIALSPDPTCKHFKAMKNGVLGFAETLYGNQSVARLKLGLVPYHYNLRMPDLNAIPPLMEKREIEGTTGVDAKDPDPTFFREAGVAQAGEMSTVLPLTFDKNKVMTAINGLNQTEEGAAWSRTNLPTLTAGLMLDPTQHQYFANGVKPEEFTNENVQKIFILMTDGSNVSCCFTNTKGNFQEQYLYLHKPDNDQTIRYCELLKEHNVKVYSIIFDVKEGDPGGKEVNNIFARCASGAYSDATANVADTNTQLLCKNKQNCYNVSTDEQLTKVYKDIANNFFVARTSK